jgi:hypothetical protein
LLQDINRLEQSLGVGGGGKGVLTKLLEKVDAFEDAVFRAGEAVSVVRALTGGPLIKGSLLPQGWIDEAQWLLDKLYEIHNRLNDIPGASALPSVSAEDLDAPTLEGYEPEGGGDSTGGGSGGRGAATATTTTASPEAIGESMLPAESTTTSSSGTSSSGGSSGTADSATGGGAGTVYNTTYNVKIDNSGGGKINKQQVVTWIEQTHNRIVRNRQGTVGG